MPITITDKITPSLNKIQKRMDDVPQESWRFWRSITPKKTGNARRKTKLRGTKIEAKYDYATNLDKGSSKKAPRGMSKPTLAYLDKLIKRNLRK